MAYALHLSTRLIQWTLHDYTMYLLLEQIIFQHYFFFVASNNAVLASSYEGALYPLGPLLMDITISWNWGLLSTLNDMSLAYSPLITLIFTMSLSIVLNASWIGLVVDEDCLLINVEVLKEETIP